MKCKVCEEEECIAKGLCNKCYQKQYYQDNIRKMKRQHKGYWKKNKKYLNIKQKEYRKQNKEKIKQIDRTKYLKNKDKILIRQKVYVEKNKIKIGERHRKYRLDNLEKVRAGEKAYRERYPERYKLILRNKNHRRRLKLKGLYPEEISIELQKKIIERDKICVYCNCKVYKKGEIGYTKENEETIDHIIAIDNDGNNNPFNLVLACGSCNSSKDNNDVFKWCELKGIKVPDIVIELLNKQKEQTRLEVY